MELIDLSLKEPEEQIAEVTGSEVVSDAKVKDDGQTIEDIIIDDIGKLIKSPVEEQKRPNVPLPVS